MTARAEASSAVRAEAFQPGHLTWRALASRRHCFKYVCTLHSTPYIIEYLMNMENQFSCGSCGQVSKTAKKLQALKVTSFGIILHKIGHVVCPFSGLMFWK